MNPTSHRAVVDNNRCQYLHIISCVRMTSLAALTIPPIQINGSDMVGIAVQGDMRIPVDQRLRVPSASAVVGLSDQQRVALAISGLAWPRGTENVGLLDVTAALIAVREYYGRWAEDAAETGCDGDVVEIANVHDPAYFLDEAQVARATAASARLSDPESVNAAQLIIAATKINWYQTNHHTGQGRIQGYAAKVAKFVLNAEPSVEFVAAMHRIGHWCSTLSVLHGLVAHGPGVPADVPHAIIGLRNGPEFRAPFPRAASDAALRIGSAPAGAARLSTVHAALARAAKTPYAAAFSGVDGISALGTELVEMQVNAAHWHVGAQYIAGVPRKEVTSVTEDILAAASLFVHLTMPGSSLSRAPVLMSQGDASALVPVVGQTIVAIRMAMSTGRASSDEIVRLAERSAHVVNANPLASLVAPGQAFDVAAAIAP